MLKYKLRNPPLVDAFQMTEIRCMDFSEWPRWLSKAWDGDPGNVGTLYRESIGPGVALMLSCPSARIRVKVGDWIVKSLARNGGPVLMAMRPEDFVSTYESQEVTPTLPDEDEILHIPMRMPAVEMMAFEASGLKKADG